MKTYFSILILLLLFACERNSKHEIYQENADKLIYKIFNQPDHDSVPNVLIEYEYDDILEQYEVEQPHLEIKVRHTLKNELNLESYKQLFDNLKVSCDYKLNDTLSNSNFIKILSLKKYIELSDKFNCVIENGSEDQINKFMDEEISENFVFISKPIFNDNYNIAIIQTSLGFIHNSRRFNTYYLDVNGNWNPCYDWER